MYRDVTTFFYAQAYLQALRDVDAALRSGARTIEDLRHKWRRHQPQGVTLPKPQRSEVGCIDNSTCEDTYSQQVFCASAQQASWNGRYNLTAWRVLDKDSPYKSLNDSKGSWHLQTIKGTSRIGGAREAEKAEELNDPTCTAHSDRVHTWVSSGLSEGWITFRVPKMSKHFKGQVILCTTRNRAKSAKEFLIMINGKPMSTVKRGDPGGIIDGSGSGCRRVVKDAPRNTEYVSIAGGSGFGLLALILV